MISSIGMFVVFVLPDAKALRLGVWAAFPLRVPPAETSLRYWDEASHIMCHTIQPSNRSYTIVLFPLLKALQELLTLEDKPSYLILFLPKDTKI